MLHPPTDTQTLKKPIFVDVIEIEEPPPVGIGGEQVEVMMVIPLRPQMTWRNPPRIY